MQILLSFSCLSSIGTIQDKPDALLDAPSEGSEPGEKESVPQELQAVPPQTDPQMQQHLGYSCPKVQRSLSSPESCTQGTTMTLETELDADPGVHVHSQ